MKFLTLVPGVGPYLSVAWSFATSRIGSLLIVAMLCFGCGYHLGAQRERDKVAVAQATETQRQHDAGARITTDANGREAKRETERVETDQRINDHSFVTQKGCDCRLSSTDVDWLRNFGRPGQEPPAKRTIFVRSARPRPNADNGKACTLSVAEHRAALFEANRRLRNDRLFWDDVVREFGEQP